MDLDISNTEPTDLESPGDIALADRMKVGREQILTELRKKIIGQEEIINETLLTLFVGGNSLIVGVPGLAKTLLIQTMAQVLDLKFSRIQFTPDLMPSDITGTDIIQEDPGSGGRKMVFAPGPVFTNILLADEINRAPAKVQAALLDELHALRLFLQAKQPHGLLPSASVVPRRKLRVPAPRELGAVAEHPHALGAVQGVEGDDRPLVEPRPPRGDLGAEVRLLLAGEDRRLETDAMIAFWRDWADRYPIVSIEDGLAEGDWGGWRRLTTELGDRLQIVGDVLEILPILTREFKSVLQPLEN